ncbi:MAG TPA: hypothetical protein PKZ53_28470, partial [Acidobacteriota bacterium]|nr:hypothetical protein [Acidobacteriota bacterium]
MPLTPTRAYFRPRNLKVLGMAALSSLLVWPAALPVSTTSAHSSAPSAPLASALPPASAVSSDKLNELREDYQKLPMSFEVNQGQAHSKVKYLSHSSGYNVLFTNNEVLLTMDATPPVKKTGKGKSAAKSTAPVADTVSLQFKGGNPSARIYGDRMMGKAHYFVGNDPAKWLRNITTYHNVRYEKVYPGVDVVYYGHDKKLEYDVIVAAGADPKTVRLNFGGVKNMRLNQNGELELTTAHGVVCQQKPVAYQLVNKLR